MMYRNSEQFSHHQSDKIGVLITNLGTPESPTKPALRRYLKEFLSDPRVVEVPRFIWWFILNLVILNIRPKRSARAYSTVWTEQGSPLMTITRQQRDALQQRLTKLYGENVLVEFAMRYGQPAIKDVVHSMLGKGVRKLLVLPLYPQYCASTTASTFDALAQDFTQRRWLPELRFVTQYHDNPDYISALANKISAHWQSHGKAQKLIFSYHGIPKRYLTNGDPYHCQCLKTTRLVAERLGLTQDEYLTTFQSRFGREEWLQPYTDETLKGLPAKGAKSVQVICPGFSADCLETIEEIGEENREVFLAAGGESYQYIAALNSDDDHMAALTRIIETNLYGWTIGGDNEARSKLALAAGAEK
ncbi:ferrochelatase [Alteromonas aestuariivivens]|uniref:Ferrochelatase n=1 Tax=Alteromonas aestuariivivens TaxID=1938339 RepID=A0A3D8M8V5_9ALTE|nr:ferrochelatase [Alteromonas aestuariivivens]RDV25631.1 ferrochelatase [Alteromonas aestuariivivens]